jgi:hypothetical protein
VKSVGFDAAINWFQRRQVIGSSQIFFIVAANKAGHGTKGTKVISLLCLWVWLPCL